jgi:pyruvate, water dikinase
MKLTALGLGVSQGKVRGKVKIIKTFDNHTSFNENDILVTNITDPTMVPMMNKAAGIICNIGGLTSHPSIVSRELGIPCIVSAKCVETNKPITEVLQDNQIIEMNGETGEIFLSEEDKNWRLKWR